MSDLLRLLGGCIFLALAALTAAAAPNQLLWRLSVAATEGGHWLAIGALVTAIPWVGQGKLGKLGGFMGLGAAALFALPIFHASQMNQDLPRCSTPASGPPSACSGRFAEDLRPQPIVMKDLVYSVQSRPVRLEERVFNTADGEKPTLDIYKPGYNHGQPVPGVLVIHGGSWQTGDSRDLMALNAYLAARDYIVVAINYRLAPKWKFRPAATMSCRRSRISRSTATSSASTRRGWRSSDDRPEASWRSSRRTPLASRRSAGSCRSTVRPT